MFFCFLFFPKTTGLGLIFPKLIGELLTLFRPHGHPTYLWTNVTLNPPPIGLGLLFFFLLTLFCPILTQTHLLTRPLQESRHFTPALLFLVPILVEFVGHVVKARVLPPQFN